MASRTLKYEPMGDDEDSLPTATPVENLFKAPELASGTLMQLDPREIAPNPLNPRKRGLGDISSLVASIKENGIIEPGSVCAREVFVRHYPDVASEVSAGKRWVLIFGHRRHTAALEAGTQEYPTLLRNDIAERQLIEEIMAEENNERQDLSPVEQAESVRAYKERRAHDKQLRLSTEEVGRRLYGWTPGTTSKYIALLKLPDHLLELVHAGVINRGEGYALSRKPTAIAVRAWEIKVAADTRAESDAATEDDDVRKMPLSSAITIAEREAASSQAIEREAAFPQVVGREAGSLQVVGHEAGYLEIDECEPAYPLATEQDSSSGDTGERNLSVGNPLSYPGHPGGGTMSHVAPDTEVRDLEGPEHGFRPPPQVHPGHRATPGDRPAANSPAAERSGQAGLGVPEARQHLDAPSPTEPEESAAVRASACQRMVGQDKFATLAETVEQLVRFVLSDGGHRAALALAHTWLRKSGKGPSEDDAHAYRAAVAYSDDSNLARRLAYAMSVAADELRIAEPGRTWDERDARHLDLLRTHTGHQYSAWELQQLARAGLIQDAETSGADL